VATRKQVEGMLRDLAARLDGADQSFRSALPNQKTLQCRFPDLDLAYVSRVEDGRLSVPCRGEDPEADIKITVASDDLDRLLSGQASFLSLFASGRVRIEAGLTDLIRLRSLL
jgi:alkyl sulfatase BDS1-like metallo-beta-lactamase superfamily hydrolase